MGKNKLKKFAAMAAMPNVVQLNCTGAPAEMPDHPLKGRWAPGFFGNSLPLVLELGCGHGEYSVDLARLHPDCNFIGVDIKGARMYTGARAALEKALKNVAFLRTDIERLASFFGSGEVSEIWITFPDPQMKKTNKRLTSTRFMHIYEGILRSGGVVRLKTDSPFLFEYTRRMAEANALLVLEATSDLYSSEVPSDTPARLIQTTYERQWLARGMAIKYIVTDPTGITVWREPREDDIPRDGYRSINQFITPPTTTAK